MAVQHLSRDSGGQVSQFSFQMHLQCFKISEGRRPASYEVAFLYFRPVSLIVRINFPLCNSDNKTALAAAMSELFCSDFSLFLWGRQFAPAVLVSGGAEPQHWHLGA